MVLLVWDNDGGTEKAGDVDVRMRRRQYPWKTGKCATQWILHCSYSSKALDQQTGSSLALQISCFVNKYEFTRKKGVVVVFNLKSVVYLSCNSSTIPEFFHSYWFIPYHMHKAVLSNSELKGPSMVLRYCQNYQIVHRIRNTGTETPKTPPQRHLTRPRQIEQFQVYLSWVINLHILQPAS